MEHGVGSTLIQTKKNSEFRYEIIDGQKLIISKRHKNKCTKHIVSLLALRPEGKQIFHASWKLLFAGLLIFLLIILAKIFLINQVAADNSIVNTLIISVGMIVAATFIIFFLTSICRKYIIISRHAGIPVVELAIAKPDKEHFQEFISHVQSCITEIQSKRKLSQSDQYAGEMRMLRRLASEGLLNKEHYEQAKLQLLGLFGEKA